MSSLSRNESIGFALPLKRFSRLSGVNFLWEELCAVREPATPDGQRLSELPST